MEITLINGNPESSNILFEERISTFIEFLSKEHQVNCFILRDLEIKSCTGCFNCWVQNPGECIFDDDRKKIREAAINSDILLFTSPVIMGFTSALLKHAQDKLIPLLLPYIEFVNKECHHQKRYENYPNLGLLYQNMDDTSTGDVEIMHQIYQWFAINFRAELVLFENIEKNPEEIIHALNIN